MKKTLLAIVSLSLSSFAFAQSFCTELFFSEYVEGSGNSKALEIYNPTTASVNMSNYRIVRYSNGSPTGVDSLNLSGTLASHDVWVVVNGQTVSQPNSPAADSALQAMADQLGNVYPDPLYFNGDDAICLVRVSPYAIIDIFGKIGEDPGQSWSDIFPYTDAQGAWWTKDHTLQRKNNVTGGTTVNPTAFNVTAEYDSLPENTWTGLGQHNCVCNNTGISEGSATAKVNVFPNPTNGIININATEKIARVEILNALGQVVYMQQFGAAEQSMTQVIDLSNMPGGMYMMQLQLTEGKRVTSKITLR